jgi:hypothetical protein
LFRGWLRRFVRLNHKYSAVSFEIFPRRTHNLISIFLNDFIVGGAVAWLSGKFRFRVMLLPHDGSGTPSQSRYTRGQKVYCDAL